MNKIFSCLVVIAAAVTILSYVRVINSQGVGVQRLKRNSDGKVSLKHHQHHSLSAASTSSSCPSYIEEYYYTDAVIDNFAPVSEQVKWVGSGQRYWLNKEFWKGPGAPIFVFIGGEGEESCLRLTDKMYLYQLAKEHGALLVDLEHRFYGESYPTIDMTTANLKYLSSSQALADLARFVTFLKNDLSTLHSSVVTIGGSYPGNLSAWFRLKYPSITNFSIASSAPLLAKVNFYEYMEVVGQSIKYFSGQSCYDAVEAAANQISTLIADGINSNGMLQVTKDFKLCSDITSDLDVATMLSDLMGNIQGTVQYNNEHSSVMNVTDICSVMTNPDADAYTNFVALNDKYMEYYGMECTDASYADTIEYMTQTVKDPSNAARPWVYQTCNEFGYYQTADSHEQPFHSFKQLNVDFYRQMCKDSFDGWSNDPEVDWTNQQYGDVHIAGTNIVFPDGTIDPWHSLSVTNATTMMQASEQSVFILGTAHCNDLYAPANSDPESLTYARQVIADTLSKVLKM